MQNNICKIIYAFLAASFLCFGSKLCKADNFEPDDMVAILYDKGVIFADTEISELIDLGSKSKDMLINRVINSYECKNSDEYKKHKKIHEKIKQIFVSNTITCKFSPRNKIIIYTYDNVGNPSKVSNSIKSVIIKGSYLSVFESKAINITRFLDSSYFIIDFSDDSLVDFLRAANNSAFEIKIKKKSGEDVNFKIQKNNTFEAPGVSLLPDLADDTVGLWVPVGLFGTNFHKSGGGMQFQAAPIGVAIGTKIFPAKDVSYIGISGITSWVVGTTKDTSTDHNSSFSASGAAFGGLFDLSSWLYIGCSYSIDLTSNKKNPGWSMLLGLGPKVINFFNPLNVSK